MMNKRDTPTVSPYEMFDMLMPWSWPWMYYTDHNPWATLEDFELVKEEWVAKYELLVSKNKEW